MVCTHLPRDKLPAPSCRRENGRTAPGGVYRLQAFQFDGVVYGVCPLRSQCIAAQGRQGRRVQIHPQEGMLQQARALPRLYAKFKGSNGCHHVGTPPTVAGVGGFFTIRRQRCCPGTSGYPVPLSCNLSRLRRLKCVKSSLQQSADYDAYRARRVVVEHRLARLVQLGIRQAHYFGRVKTKFQLYLAATVANLTLVAGKIGLLGSTGGGAAGHRVVYHPQ